MCVGQVEVILRKHQRDLEQNVWFPQNDLKLVRITDLSVNAMSDEQLTLWCKELLQVQLDAGSQTKE